MTTWSVVKDDTTEKRRPLRYFRYLLLVCVAGLVISLGIGLAPREASGPPEPAFSEKARASALDTSLALLTSAERLADATTGPQQLAFSRLVTLLTTQSRALLLPGQPATAQSSVATSSASSPSSSSPSSSSLSTPQPATAEELVKALAVSGVQRTSDAGAADGGMARLLAAIGASQLLEASSLAAANGVPAPDAAIVPPANLEGGPTPASAQAQTTGTAPATPGDPATPGGAHTSASSEGVEPDGTAEASPGCQTPTPAPTPGQFTPSQDASLAAALSVTVKTEAETVYAYQVAQTRLEGEAAKSASALLSRHQQLVRQAEDLSRLYCIAVPEQEPGYSLQPPFLQSPALGLASVEARTLPVYADLVALSEGRARTWAIAGLVEATRRAALWGSDPGPVPGVGISVDQLPPLTADGGPTPSATAASSTTDKSHK
jgi:hypothetical protein